MSEEEEQKGQLRLHVAGRVFEIDPPEASELYGPVDQILGLLADQEDALRQFPGLRSIGLTQGGQEVWLNFDTTADASQIATILGLLRHVPPQRPQFELIRGEIYLLDSSVHKIGELDAYDLSVQLATILGVLRWDDSGAADWSPNL
jgi:hypothetical protein